MYVLQGIQIIQGRADARIHFSFVSMYCKEVKTGGDIAQEVPSIY